VSGWKKVSLGELVQPAQTWNPLRSKAESVFDYIDLSAVDQDQKLITEARQISCAEAPSRARQLVQYGDVLVSTVRPNLNGVARVTKSLNGSTASTGFCVLRPKESELDGSYLFHWVKSPVFVADMVKKATGASYPAVSDRIIFESPIPLPPLPRQRRIAEVLDKAEALRAKRRAALAQLDALTQSLFLDTFGDPITNPKHVKTSKLGSLCIRVTDGTHQTPKWSAEGHPFLFVSNIVSGEITFDTEKFISDETHSELTRRCPIELGDVLYSTVGSYGVPAIVRCNRKFAFQRHIAHLKPDRALLDSEFLAAMLASPPLKRQADRSAKGVAQKTVNLSEIREFIVFHPPLQVQREFARRVAAVEKLKTAQRAALAELDALFASLQHRAFRGEL
jgi:type I restriction enzyme S subunit